MAELSDIYDSTEVAYPRKTVSYVLINDVVTGLTVRFNVVNKLAENFDFCGNISNNVWRWVRKEGKEG